MKAIKVFNVLRAAVVVGALVGALVVPGAVGAASRDADRDGLTNSFERNWSHTNPLKVDSDRDGIRDGRENPDHDGLTNRQEQTRLNTGITVVGKRAVVPAGVRLGRNVKVNEGARPADYGGKRVFASGSTIEVHLPPARGAGKGRAGTARSRTDGEPLSGRMTAAPRGGSR